MVVLLACSHHEAGVSISHVICILIVQTPGMMAGMIQKVNLFKSSQPKVDYMAAETQIILSEIFIFLCIHDEFVLCPAGQTSFGQRPVVQRPAVQRPAVQRPAVQRPVIQRPAVQRWELSRQQQPAREAGKLINLP